MYTIVNDIKCKFTVLSALIITLFTTIVKGQDRCSFQNFVECAKPLSVLTDSGLTFFNSKQDLEKVCPNLKEAIKCIHGFTRHCMNKEDRQHFKELFRGTGSVVHDLCREGSYQQEYLKHAPCMTETSIENERCFENFTMTMDKLKSNTMHVDSSLIDVTSELKKKRAIADEGIRNVCCAFQEFTECSTTAVRNNCGDYTAEFSRLFLNRMSSSMLSVHCTEYGKRQCGLSEAMSFPSSASSFQTLLGLSKAKSFPSSASSLQALLGLLTTVISIQFLLR